LAHYHCSYRFLWLQSSDEIRVSAQIPSERGVPNYFNNFKSLYVEYDFLRCQIFKFKM